MEKYLEILHRIKPSSPDASDYDNFCSAAQHYLHTHPDSHHQFAGPLAAAVQRLKDPLLVSLAYRILGSLSTAAPALPERVVKAHFKSRAIRGSMLQYILSSRADYMHDRVVKKLVEHPTYVCCALTAFVNAHPACASRLMSLRDPAYALKQLALIGHCDVEFDPASFVRCLGSASKLQAFKAHEAFTLHHLRKTGATECSEAQDTCGTVTVPEAFLYSPRQDLEIESPMHFLTFGFNFIRDRDEVVRRMRDFDAGSLLAIVNRYAARPFLDAGCIRPVALCYARRAQMSAPAGAEELDFDHLFHRSSHKAISDCLEV
ncbi:hypothetical protein PAPHI01_0996 [Pancytospora philotis]|nr:hypothetical protein PAPHI01_0996 [Pancytospora philotis]